MGDVATPSLAKYVKFGDCCQNTLHVHRKSIYVTFRFNDRLRIQDAYSTFSPMLTL
jgi:hypothetical protein